MDMLDTPVLLLQPPSGVHVRIEPHPNFARPIPRSVGMHGEGIVLVLE